MENEGNKYIGTRKEKIIAVGITILSLVVIIAVGYAFFSASVSNANNEKLQTSTATMSLRFADNDNGISGTLNLGESITKKFTLENTGTKDAYAKINWVDLVNTYMSGSLTYILEQSTSENGSYSTIDSKNVPISSSATTTVLKNGILVPVNTTYYYKLTITLNNLENVNQNSDINAIFSSYFGLEEGSLSGAELIQNLVAGEPTNTTNEITKTAPAGAACTNTLAYDGTTDNNLRYVGADPCNYVTFNDEVAGWRIVGIMNNVDDGTGNLETRIKLIRNESLGEFSWDTSDSSINDGYGINDWTQADLKNELNGDYLDTSLQTNTNWYNGSSNGQTGVYDYTKGLSQAAQGLIGNTKWNLGGHNTDDAPASTFYTAERGTTVYSGSPTEWTGKVALIYPSDYGYAVGGSIRSTCLGKNLYTYNSDNCYTNDWLHISTYQWLLSPDSRHNIYAFFVYNAGRVSGDYTSSAFSVRPAVYLESGVTISGGNGTPEKPYVLE